MCEVVTPLKLQAWQEALEDFPDKAFAEYILRGIQAGFRIGFNAGLMSRKGNLSSASDQPDVVEKYLHEELQARRLIRVHHTDSDKALHIQCSPFGVILLILDKSVDLATLHLVDLSLFSCEDRALPN